MKTIAALVGGMLALLLVACAKDTATTEPEEPGTAVHGLRVINAYTQPVDVLVDGTLAASAVTPGRIDSIAQAAGSHAVAFRAAGTTALVSLNVTTGTGALRTIAVVRSGASFSASEFGDTNAIVPAGATKVRVFHLAPNAGEIQVYRTQPDWSTPIEWQFPFLYDSSLTDPLAHPYFQSTVGTWDIRAWRKPSEVALGWDGTTARVSFALASGEKRTVVVLDKPGGGITVSVLDQ
jgi:hypothetical protein